MTTTSLNAAYPAWLCDVAEYACGVNDYRAMTWLARRLPAEGVPVGYRMTLMPFPFPEVFGTLGTSPDVCSGDRVASFDAHACEDSNADVRWLRRLQQSADRSMKMLRAASRADESIIDEVLDAPDELPIVRDWLDALPEVDPRMLDKLLKITWEQGVQHAKAYHTRLARRAIRIASEEGTADPILSVDGYRWLHLVTSDALDRESRAMGHCVGDGGYDDTTWMRGEDGEPCRPAHPMDALVGIWSLRDRGGRSVLTAEIGMGCIEQLMSRFNGAPEAVDVPHIGVLVSHLSGTMEQFLLPDWLVKDVRDGSLHHVHAMPDGIHLDDGCYMYPGNWSQIPAWLRIDGNTVIAHSGSRPVTFQGLHVNGRLKIHGNVRLDAGLVVEGDLDLSDAEDKILPDGARVTGQIFTEIELPSDPYMDSTKYTLGALWRTAMGIGPGLEQD